MGFHVCEYCRSATSSGDVILHFRNGHSYIVPDMIVHYAERHECALPAEFVYDVSFTEVETAERTQTKHTPQRVGYFSGPFETKVYAFLFYTRLRILLQQAEETGNRQQTRGIPKI